MADLFIVQGTILVLEKQIFRKIGIFEGKQAVFLGHIRHELIFLIWIYL